MLYPNIFGAMALDPSELFQKTDGECITQTIVLFSPVTVWMVTPRKCSSICPANYKYHHLCLHSLKAGKF